MNKNKKIKNENKKWEWEMRNDNKKWWTIINVKDQYLHWLVKK